ncbi:MAG: HEAT repeat domain-containing protein [Candidatus Binataceae bacterium]|nr:HEAT repeat domain-containing protein [Candidatus Binataceae bacterium]
MALAYASILILIYPAITPARVVVGSGLFAIRKMVSEDRIPGAVRLLQSEYRFDTPAGQFALRQFSGAVLQRSLNNSDPFERCYAATALARHDDWRGQPVIVQALGSPNPMMQKAAVEGLAAAGNPEAVQILGRFYHLSGPVSRIFALEGLAEIKNSAVVPILLDAAKDPNSVGSYWAANGLGHIGDRELLPYLHSLLTKTTDPAIRTETARAIILLGDRTWDAIGIIEAGLNSQNMQTASDAALTLGVEGDPSMIPVLEQVVFSRRQNRRVQISAAIALTHFGISEGLPLLDAGLRDPRRREYLRPMLAQIDLAIGLPLLARAIHSEDQQFRLAAIEAIGINGGVREIALLGDAMEQNHDAVDLAQIAWSLGNIGTQQSLPLLFQLVQNPDPEVRDTAADALGNMTNNSRVEVGAAQTG